ncbi:MAG: urease accessory UreF family protein [Pseudomonadota bacterium]
MAMPTESNFLTLVQWLSPSFPTGAFAYSHGLETAILEGWITDPESLEHWLRDCLVQGSGRSDAIWLRLAYGSDDIAELDRTARAFAISHERKREAERQGKAFVKVVNSVWGMDLPDLILPVAFGRAAGAAGLDKDQTVAHYLQAFVSNLVAASLRLCPIGQTPGQAVAMALHADILRVTEQTKGATEADVYGSAFVSDIAAMRHETQQPRLFQS